MRLTTDFVVENFVLYYYILYILFVFFLFWLTERGEIPSAFRHSASLLSHFSHNSFQFAVIFEIFTVVTQAYVLVIKSIKLSQRCKTKTSRIRLGMGIMRTQPHFHTPSADRSPFRVPPAHTCSACLASAVVAFWCCCYCCGLSRFHRTEWKS